MSRDQRQTPIGLWGVMICLMTVWFVVGNATVSHAESPEELQLDETSTLSDYLAYGALKSPELKAAFHRWQAAVSRVPQAEALPDPTISFGYFIREVETRVGPQRAKVGISQMFPWFGKRGLRGDVAEHAAQAAWADFEAKKLRVSYSIERAYWEYWYLARSVEVTAENKRLVAHLEGVARWKYAAGTAPYSAVIKAQVELGKLEDRLATLMDRRFPVSAELNAALGRSAEPVLPWPAEGPGETPLPGPSSEELSELLAQNSPELKKARAMVAKEEARVALARRDYYPNLGFGLDYVITDKSIMPDTKDSGKDAVVAMLSINLPIFFGKYRAAQREAEADHIVADKTLEDRTNHLMAALQTALFGFRDAERKIGLYRDTLLPKARQSLEVARQAFEGERADFLDLIDAERTLLEFDLSYARALADRSIRHAEIEMIVGTEISPDARIHETGSMDDTQQ